MAKTDLGKKLAFASCDFYGGGVFNIVNFLYPGFLALTVGINAYWVGIIMLVARIWDAIIDPIIGSISDRTKSKLGKRRIYMVVAAPLVLLSMFFLFFPYSFPNIVYRIIAVMASYLIFVSVQSSIMIPYYSMSSEISADYQKRASYNSYRLGFSIFASILCVAVPGIIVSLFDEKTGYQVMSLSFGLIFAISVLVTGLFAKEEISTPVIHTKVSFKELAKPLSLRPFRQYLGMFIVLQMAMAIMSGLFFFYIDFYVTKTDTLNHVPSMVGMISAALMFSMQIVALPVYLKMIEKKGKTFTYRFGSYVWIVSALLLLVVPPDVNPIVIYILGAIMGFGISAPGLVPHTMLGDVVDAGQLKFKDRLDGQMSGFTNFVSTLGQAVGLAIAMFLLGIADFQEQVLGAAKVDAQPESATLMIRLIMALAPLILMGIGSFISMKYKINAKKQQEIKQAIQDESPNADDLLSSL